MNRMWLGSKDGAQTGPAALWCKTLAARAPHFVTRGVPMCTTPLHCLDLLGKYMEETGKLTSA